MTTSPEGPRRKPKGDKRVRTRAALLEAARSLVREKGYGQTTLEEVATRAGMTTGAIYGNFRNRAELFAALGEAYWPPIKPRVRTGATLREAMRAIAQATIDIVPERQDAAAGRLTGMAHTLGHAELLARVRDVTDRHSDLGADWLASLGDPRDLPMPPGHLVRVAHALSEGLVFQRLLTPDLVPDAVVFAAFDALATARPTVDAPARPDVP